jgi:hypothetical protein
LAQDAGSEGTIWSQKAGLSGYEAWSHASVDDFRTGVAETASVMWHFAGHMTGTKEDQLTGHVSGA